jgi:hypothetical protein
VDEQGRVLGAAHSEQRETNRSAEQQALEDIQ